MEQHNDVKLINKPTVREPAMYTVFFMDDPETPMDFVVMLLEKHFNIDIGAAIDIMFQINDKGSSCVGAYSHDVAEMIHHKCFADITKHEYPLQIRTMPLT